MEHINQVRIPCALIVISAALGLSGCGGGGGGSTTPQTYSLSSTISGLTGSGLVLSVNGTAVTVTSGATSVALAKGLASGSAYTVSVQTQPTGLSCAVAGGTGTIASANITSVAVTCAAGSYTIGGSISGLTATGLLLLDNEGDATNIPANATQFSMQTKLAAGAKYSISVGSQPYGIILACTIANASGTVSANVTTVAVSCATVNPTPKLILRAPAGINSLAVDAHDNVFFTNNGSGFIWMTPYNAGSWGPAVLIGSGFNLPGDVAVDASGDVFVADTGNNAVKEIPFSAGSYGSPVTIASGITNPVSVAVDAAGNVYVNDGSVWEIPFSAGRYGAAVIIYSQTQNAMGQIEGAIAVDAAGDVFVHTSTTEYGSQNVGYVIELPYSAGSYGAPVTIATGTTFAGPGELAVDAAGDVLVSGTANGITKIPYSAGSYGPPVGLGIPVAAVQLTMDAAGNLFVCSPTPSFEANEVTEIPYSGGSYGAPVTIFSPEINNPSDMAMDAAGNVFVADTGNNAVKEIPYSAGSYGAPIAIGSGFNEPGALALDVAGDVFVVDIGNNAIKEIPYSGGSYGAPVVLGSGFFPGLGGQSGATLDEAGNLYVSDFYVWKFAYSNGEYSSPVKLSYDSGTAPAGNIALDTAFNMYLSSSSGYNGASVWEVPFVDGNYGSPMVLGGSGITQGAVSMARDTTGNLFVAGENGAVLKIPHSDYNTAVPVQLGYVTGNYVVAVDSNGRLYTITPGNIWVFAP
jgi:hypothetical protein